jgi:hypothetical protein
MSEQPIATDATIKRIPYGLADFAHLRQDNGYYVDKTHFIPLLEAQPRYLFLIRPRRLGKSLWLSLLQHYYDINKQADFDFLFGDTYIGAHPTPERNSYLIMFLNFALINPDPHDVKDSFEKNGQAVVQDFLIRYERFFDTAARQLILAEGRVEDQLRQLFFHADRQQLKIYLFIDEYDNFANTILATAGQYAYHSLTHGAGFFRYFFNLLKGATAGQISGLTRLFITGVSPITMDDVTSGFNIGDNITLEAQFNELIGFTETEVRAMLTYYHTAGALTLDVDFCLTTMKLWYNNYAFAKGNVTPMFNADLVLHFVKQAIREQAIPDRLIDQNMRLDYTKLRHLIAVDKQLNGNFSQLRAISETGEAVSDIVISFPLERLRAHENFISQLFYFGLLTISGEHEGRTLLRIPNRTIKDLIYSYIREGFQDVDLFRLDLWQLANLLSGMAYRGDWQPFFDFIAAAIREQTSIRDYLNGEKVIQGFLLAYLNLTHFFLPWSEKELGGGFVDFYLEPFLARYPDMPFGYLVELKYIPRNEFTKAKLQEQIAEAEGQLARYANDPRVQPVLGRVALKKLVLVYNGWELVYREEWSGAKPAVTRQKRTRKKL